MGNHAYYLCEYRGNYNGEVGNKSLLSNTLRAPYSINMPMELFIEKHLIILVTKKDEEYSVQHTIMFVNMQKNIHQKSSVQFHRHV